MSARRRSCCMARRCSLWRCRLHGRGQACAEAGPALVHCHKAQPGQGDHGCQAQAHHCQAGAREGVDPRQGGAPVPSDQAAVRLRQGALQRIGEEHRADRHLVCAVQSVDGAPSVAQGHGIAAAAVCTRMGEKPGNGQKTEISGSNRQIICIQRYKYPISRLPTKSPSNYSIVQRFPSSMSGNKTGTSILSSSSGSPETSSRSAPT
jgi:hypothetical protein